MTVYIDGIEMDREQAEIFLDVVTIGQVKTFSKALQVDGNFHGHKCSLCPPRTVYQRPGYVEKRHQFGEPLIKRPVTHGLGALWR